jgi:hypothetical protein
VKRAAPQDRPGVIRHSDVIHPGPWGLSCWSPGQAEPLPGIGQMRGNARRCLLLADAFYKARLDGAARHRAVNEHLQPGML